MNYKVKELFNTLYSDEEKEHKSNLNSKQVKEKKGFMFNGQKYGYRTRIDRDSHAEEYLKSFSDETYFIICPDNELFFPMKWDELEINYSDINVRYCEQCDKDIYKVDNDYLYKQCKEEYLCMAISLTIEYYNSNGVDLEKILFTILPPTKDEKFKMRVEEKNNKINKKG